MNQNTELLPRTKKPGISRRTKKTLTYIGIGFGTVMLFFLSFILTFSLIVNPITFISSSDPETINENKELKSQVESLNDKIEYLNAALEKKGAGSASTYTQPEVVTTETPSSSGSTTSTAGSANSSAVETTPDETTSNPSGEDSSSSTAGGTDETAGDFSSDTVTSTDEETPEDIEAPITIIEIVE